MKLFLIKLFLIKLFLINVFLIKLFLINVFLIKLFLINVFLKKVVSYKVVSYKVVFYKKMTTHSIQWREIITPQCTAPNEEQQFLEITLTCLYTVNKEKKSFSIKTKSLFQHFDF